MGHWGSTDVQWPFPFPCANAKPVTIFHLNTLQSPARVLTLTSLACSHVSTPQLLFSLLSPEFSPVKSRIILAVPSSFSFFTDAIKRRRFSGCLERQDLISPDPRASVLQIFRAYVAMLCKK